MPGFMSGLAGGLKTGAGLARGGRTPPMATRPGADASEMARQNRISGLMGRIGQTNMNTSTARPMAPKPALPAMTPKPGPRLAPTVTGGRTPPMATPRSVGMPAPGLDGARQAWEAQRARAAAAAGGNETKAAMFAEGGMVGRSYAKS